MQDRKPKHWARWKAIGSKQKKQENQRCSPTKNHFQLLIDQHLVVPNSGSLI